MCACTLESRKDYTVILFIRIGYTVFYVVFKFQVYHNNSIESLFCQTRFFGCCLTKQLAKTEETKIKITFFQDTISVRKNLKNFIHISGSIQKGASSLRSWWRLTTSPRRTMPTMSSTATSWPQSFRYDQWYR